MNEEAKQLIDRISSISDNVKKDLKPFVKGKIFTGFAGGVKKFIKQRGGKV